MKTATRRFALWRADLEGGVCAAPEECAGRLTSVAVVLEHRQRGITPTRQVFASALRQDVEWQFDGLEWPADVRPGTIVTVTWAGGEEVVARTHVLDEPLRVDGIDYFHEYDPKVVTREFDPGTSNRGQVLNAVRRQGRVFEDGSAVLAEAGLAARCGLGRGARGAFLLRNAVDQLIREGYLTRVTGSADSSGYPSYPAVAGQKAADMLFYAPLVEPAPDPADPEGEGGEGGERSEHWVKPFVRRLPAGAHASEKQVHIHEQAVEDERFDTGSLAPGYTFVKRHHRGG